MASLSPLRTRQFEIDDLRGYLAGEWSFERSVIDHRGERLEFLGDAFVDATRDAELIYSERAFLRSGPDLGAFSRTYRYVPTGATSADVLFEDGSFFYRLDLARARCRARHDCRDDVYLGLILATPSAWLTRWRCFGPAKDYVVTTRLRRIQIQPVMSDTRQPFPH
jgi:hypothetical protein